MPDFPQELGRFIFLANPYKAVPLTGTNTWPATPGPASPVPFPAAANDQWYGLCLDEAEAQEYAGEWEFKGTERYVARAIRIPYMYYREGANGLPIRVVDHLLIGYEGGGGGN